MDRHTASRTGTQCAPDPAQGPRGEVLEPSLAEWLRRSATATVVLASSGAVLCANPAAQRIAAREDALRLGIYGLHALRGRDDVRLQELILGAGLGSRPRAGPGFLRLPRRSGGRDYLLQAAPLECVAAGHDERTALVCVVIWDTDTVMPLEPEHLKSLFGLTPAEIRLAAQLLAGRTAEEAAAALGLAVTTVRYQLTRLYRKTQTRRHGELLGLLRQVAGTLVRP